MACYYRRVGKLRTALKFLEQALSIEGRLNKIDTQADTHLNICAVLSQLNKHELALNHAMSAVILLQEDLLFKAVNGEKKEEEEERKQKSGKGKDPNKDRTSVLAIAYHNMGVEQEFLRSYHAAILSYKKAVNFAEKHLGPDDGITENLRNVYENARSELDPSFKKKKASGKKKKNDPHRAHQQMPTDDEMHSKQMDDEEQEEASPDREVEHFAVGEGEEEEDEE